MTSILNHIKKNDSLNDKQLVIFNSDYKDDANQNSNSFTYTFDSSVERVSKIEINSANVPNSFYNVSNDGTTMNLTVTNINETYQEALNVNDVEIQNNTIQSANKLNGSINKAVFLDSAGNTTVIKTVTNKSFIYICGNYNNGPLSEYPKQNNFISLSNEGFTDIFVCKYDITQNFIWRFKISGVLDESYVDIDSNDTLVVVAGVSTSYPLTFYNITDTSVYSIYGGENNIAFLSKYTVLGEFEWSIYIIGVAKNTVKCYIDNNNSIIYLTAKFLNSSNLKIYDKTGTIVNKILAGSGNCSLLAAYSFTGVLLWINTFESGVVNTLNINPISGNPLLGIEFTDTLKYYINGLINYQLVSTGVINLVVFEIGSDGSYINSMLIGGSGQNTDIRIDTQSNKLVVAGLYNSNPIYFTNTTNQLKTLLKIDGQYNNCFIAVYEINGSDKLIKWCSNIYSNSNITNCDVSISPLFDVVLSFNYSNLLKFNELGVYLSGYDLVNTSSNNYICECAYDIYGKFQFRNKIQSQNGSIYNTSIDAKSQYIYISAYTDASTVQCYNTDSINVNTEYILNQSTKKQYGSLISSFSNVNNFIIDKTTLMQTIIKKPFNYFDLSYVIGLNSFSQNLGFNTSKKFDSIVFGTAITWSSLIVNTNVLSIDFTVYKNDAFITYTSQFKVSPAVYNPYTLAHGLSSSISKSLNVESNYVVFDNDKKIFYIKFDINGIFKINQTDLSQDLNIPLVISEMCAISDLNTASNSINIQDGAKLELKLFESIPDTLYNNVTFDKAFPNIISQTNTVLFNAVENTNSNMTLIGTVQQSDIKINDQIVFDSPWIKQDTIQTIFKDSYNWCGSAISNGGNILCLIAKDNNIFISKDGGNIWNKRCIKADWTGIDISTYTNNNCTIIAVARNSNIYISYNSGDTWTPRDSIRNWYDVSISANDNIQLACELGGYVYISNNSGLTWQAITSIGINNWTAVSINGVYMVACAYNSNFYVSNDSGVTWNEVSLVDEWVSCDIYNDIAVIVSRLGYVYKYSFATNSYIKIIIDNSSLLSKISVSNNGAYQVVIGNIGDINYSSNYGSNWNKSGIIDSWGAVSLEKNTNNLLYGISAIAYKDIYKITIPNTISLEPISVINFIGICMSSDGLYQVAYTSNTLYDSYDYGNTWKVLFNTNYNIRKLAISNDGDIQSLSTSSNIIVTYNKWSTNMISISGSFNNIVMSGNGKVQMARRNLLIYLSTNYGVTFNQITYFNNTVYTPVYSISNDSNYILVYSNAPVPNMFLSTDLGVSWTQLGNIGSDVIGLSNDGKYQIGIPLSSADRYIRRSQNYGQTWNYITLPNTLINSTTSVAISSSGKYMTINNVTNMYNSNDYGQTWALNITDNILNQISMSASGLYQACIINGDIYQSTNYGVSWYKINIIYSNVINNTWTTCALANSKYLLASLPKYIYTSNNYLLSLQRNIAFSFQQNYNSCISGDGKIQIVCNNQNGMPISWSTNDGTSWTIQFLGDNGLGLCDIVTSGNTYYLCIASDTKLYYSIITTVATTISFTPFTNISFTNKCVSVKLINIGGLVRIYCFMSNSIIYYSNNFGTSWNNMTLLGSPTLINGDVSNDGLVIITASQLGIFISTTGITGAFNYYITPISPYKIQISSNNIIYITYIMNTTYDYIYKSLDYGVSWIREPIKSNWSYLNKSENAISLIASSIAGNLMVSYDNGSKWITQPKKLQPAYIALSQTGECQVTLTAGSNLYISYSYGKSKSIKDVVTNNWKKVVMSSTFQYQSIIPYYGKILVSDNNGNTFVEKFTENYWYDIVIVNTTTQYAIIQYANLLFIYKSTDYWDTAEQIVTARNWGNLCSNDLYLYATVINGSIYRMTLTTNVWQEIVMSKKWSGICANNTYVVATAYNDYIYVSNDKGLTFTAKASKQNWNNCAITINDIFYASTLGGSLYYSTDLGNTWVSNNTNKLWSSISCSYDGKYVSAVDYNNNVYNSMDNGKNYYIDTNLFDIVSIDSNQFIQVVAQNNGSLSISKDNGKTYNLMFNITTNWSKIKIAKSYKPGTTNYVIVAIAYTNYVYISLDTGITFNIIYTIGTQGSGSWQSCDISDDGQYITVIDYYDNVYISDDYGATWNNSRPRRDKWISTAMSIDGKYQIIVSENSIVYLSSNYGVQWSSINVATNTIYQEVCMSDSGQYQTIVTRGYSLYTSSDYGVTWVDKNITKKWLCIRMSSDASKQYALVDQDSKVYYSLDKWNTYSSIETTYIFKDLYISPSGEYQLACTADYIYSHSFNIDKKLELNVDAITNNSNNANNTIYFSESSTDALQNLLPIHGFNMTDGLNYTLTRNVESPLTSIYIQPANYTPQSLVDTINKAILDINPSFIDPFKYIPELNKISFTSKFTGTVIGSSLLLKSMGFTEIPNQVLTGDIYTGTNTVNKNFTGPSSIYIKSDVISNAKKNQTVTSKNALLKSVIAPLKVTDGELNVPLLIEIYLSKKETFTTVDIQIVDNNGNIVNLNGGVVQISTYFISS
jgi:photosystem II stability/assembly factor-like uncharacterized protein